MRQDEARAFIGALNAIQGYVPPMLMAQVTGNPVCRMIEAMANGPQPPEHPYPTNGSGEEHAAQ